MLVDFELIKKAQQGDSAAFNEIVLAYRKRMMGQITRLIARPEDVEDVAQEVFLRLYFSLDQLREEKVFEPWLYRRPSTRLSIICASCGAGRSFACRTCPSSR